MNPSLITLPRRRFLKGGVAAALAPFILPSGLRAATDANGSIGVGFIGMGKQAGGLLNNFMRRKEVVVHAVCDVDTTRREAAKKKVEEHYAKDKRTGWNGCEAYNDFRKVLERDDIHAVVIVTPDHWHAVIAVAAAQAGKDIYCEKPLTQTVQEAVAIIKAVRDQKRVLQTGSQQRSAREFRVATELARNGVIGKISRVHTAFGGPPKPFDLPKEEVEPGLDWDMWLGPAPEVHYNPVLSPRGVHDHFPMWRMYSEFGGGMVTDWGAHHVDIAHWAMDQDSSGPVEVLAPPSESDTHGATLRYEGFELVHTKEGIGVSLFGADGEVHVARGKIEVKKDGKTLTELDTIENEYLADAKIQVTRSNDHIGDFISSIATRKPPIAHEEVGARTVIACHLINFAYAHNQNFKWNPATNTFADGTGNAGWLSRPIRGDWKL
jgi:predicted dehydrogenase